jgi:hypothetical protein
VYPPAAVDPEAEGGAEAVAAREFHERCQETVSRRFVGRREPLARMIRFADSDESGPLLVHGPAGEGKVRTIEQKVGCVSVCV